MYEIIKRRLERGGYTLVDARRRLHYLVASGEIQPEQAEELEAVAGVKADVTESLVARVESLDGQSDAMRRRLERMSRGLQWVASNVLPTAKHEALLAILEAQSEEGLVEE